MNLSKVIQKINDYEESIYNEIKTKSTIIFKPMTTYELQKAVNLWCSPKNIKALITYGHISTWDVSEIRYMDYLFNCVCGSCEHKKCKCGKRRFNDNINDWDVSNVITMERMFNLCEEFNQPLDKWDTKNVRNIRRMFHKCYQFEQDISCWTFNDLFECKEAFKYTQCKKPFSTGDLCSNKYRYGVYSRYIRRDTHDKRIYVYREGGNILRT